MSNYVENPTTVNAATNCWLREVEVILTSKQTNSNKKSWSMTFGNNDGDNYSIRIKGTKYLALNKDNGVVEIQNMEYDTLMAIVLGEFFYIEIKLGYKSRNNLETYFKGQVSYISQKIHSKHDTTTYISYASDYVAQFSQSRINCNLNSGINVYSALNYVFNLNGESRVTLSPSLKSLFLNKIYSSYDTTSNIITSIMGNTGSSYTVMTDASKTGTVITISNLEDKRLILLNNDSIIITQGNPTVTSAGLKLKLLPTFNFMPGDIIQMDNSLIDLSSGTENTTGALQTFNSSYIDQNGQYIIRQIDYAFENRGSTCELNINAIAVSLASKLSIGEV